MAVRSIIQGENPILRQVCEPVYDFDQSLLELLQDLTDTMKHNHGIGLAAPQISVNRQVLVADIGEGTLELMNPEIIQSEGRQTSVESCLSFPGTNLQLVRPKRIIVTGRDRFGAEVRIEASDLLARVLCHEIDHLHGILFFDHLNEEDFMAHFFQQVSGFASGTTGKQPMADTDGQDNREYQDLRLAVDMIADAAWKLELAVDLLKELKTEVKDPKPDVQRLTKIANKLAKEAGKWDKTAYPEYRKTPNVC